MAGEEDEEEEDEEKIWITEIKGSELRHRWCENKAKPLIFVYFNMLLSKIIDFQVWVLAHFWVSFWRCFGSPNGGRGHQKATSEKHNKTNVKNEPKLVPKGVPKWSQNHQK